MQGRNLKFLLEPWVSQSWTVAGEAGLWVSMDYGLLWPLDRLAPEVRAAIKRLKGWWWECRNPAIRKRVRILRGEVLKKVSGHIGNDSWKVGLGPVCGKCGAPCMFLPSPWSLSELARRKNFAFLCLDEYRLGIPLATPPLIYSKLSAPPVCGAVFFLRRKEHWKVCGMNILREREPQTWALPKLRNSKKDNGWREMSKGKRLERWASAGRGVWVLL